MGFLERLGLSKGLNLRLVSAPTRIGLSGKGRWEFLLKTGLIKLKFQLGLLLSRKISRLLIDHH